MFVHKAPLFYAALKCVTPVRNSSNLVHLVPETKEKWRILCSVCLERKPVISRPMNNLETSFKNMLDEIELENSMKSDHEMRHLSDIKRAQQLSKGKLTDEELEKTIGQTALEFEDISQKELNEFTPASRITEADKKNDVKSTDRKLDQHLLYIVKQKWGAEFVWLLPHNAVKQGENLRTAAERVLHEKCGSNIKARFLSNAPCGFYKYKYPKPVQEKEDVTGAKMFFMKAQYIGGNVDSKNDNFNWATRNELREKLVDRYYNAVNSFLIDDEPVELS